MLARFQYDLQEQETAFIDHSLEINTYDRQLRRTNANVSI